MLQSLFLLALGRSIVNKSGLTHSGHGDHQEVDAVPVAQALAVSEMGRVSGVFKLKQNLLVFKV